MYNYSLQMPEITNTYLDNDVVDRHLMHEIN